MKLFVEQEPAISDSKILILGQVGSKAYGTSTPASDDDYMAVCLAPLSCYTGLNEWHNAGTLEIKRANGAECDMVAYELHKFVKLCLNFNPNVIPLLYLRPQDYLTLHPGGQRIIDNRNLFTSMKGYHTFCGYAHSQLDSVKRGVTGKYGEKRKELIRTYGYDVKFAYHTIRLLRMLIEFMLSGEMIVYREKDAEDLMEIRQGFWSQEKFFSEADQLLSHAEILKTNAQIPEQPDYQRVNELVMGIVEDFKF